MYQRFIINLLAINLLFHFSICANEDDESDSSREDGQSIQFKSVYDFIIVGAGSGGCVMANRLSEIANWTVLLLEVGEKEMSAITDIPLTAAMVMLTRHNWGYKTEPQKSACIGLKDGVCNWPKGRALGGTSVVNYMVFNRGHANDYNLWSALGNSGWSYDDVLPYFKKMERIGADIEKKYASSYRGEKGYLDVQYAKHRTKLLDAFFETGKQMGYEQNDPNAEKMLGFSRIQATIRNGRRCSAAKAYIRPVIEKRSNLQVSTRSWVTKILINPDTKAAYGVEIVHNRKKYRVKAAKEVIVSAGVIASPQLLMLSGIGPEDHLKEFNIPVIQNLSVGYNLQDHTGLSGLAFLVNESITVTESNVQKPSNLLNYLLFGRGPFSMPGGAEGLGFLKAPNSTLPKDYPDIEVVMGAGALSGDISGTMRNMLGITKEFFEKVYDGIIGQEAFSIVPIVLRPKSRGRIQLKSRSPFHWPKMDPNYFEHNDDLEMLVKGVKLAIEIGESESFKKIGSTLHKTPFLGCEHLPFGKDEYWKCCIKRYTSSLQHQVGTCKMGPSTDPDAVVDPQLKVHGIARLRVVDASIMPVLPAAHTNAVVFMIGEKAADLIKHEWLKR